MSETSKKALLDTDFLFKTQLAQNRNREPLADLIMQFDGYDFFCHEKIISELQIHGFSPDPIPWIEEQVAKGRIQLFSDSRIRDKIMRMMDSEDYRVTYDVFAVCRKGIYPAVVIVPPMNVSVEQDFFIIAGNPYCNTLRSIPMGKQNVQGVQNQLS